jgi:hypothetical protein
MAVLEEKLPVFEEKSSVMCQQIFSGDSKLA